MTRKSLKVGTWGISISLFLFVFSYSCALADEEIRLTIKENRFIPQEIKVKADTKITLIVKNEDQAAEEFESASLRLEKLIRPGGTITLHVFPLKPGTYEFMGEFHSDTARGRLIVE